MIPINQKTKGLLFIIILICTSEFSFCQSDYRSGFVITQNGDTLSGLVNYREKAKAFRSCDFKISAEQTETTYTPDQIKGYGFVDDKFFQSREVSIKDQPVQTVFIEVLVRGTLTLYKFEDVYFVEKGDEGLQQLINETKELYVDGKRVLKSTNDYVRTLNMLVFDCEKLRGKVENVTLGEKRLTNLVEDYNQCKGTSSTTFKAKKPWIKAAIGITGGLEVSNINFERYLGGYKYLQSDFEVSRSPVMGVSFDLFYPRLHERISLHGDLLYTSAAYDGFSQYSPHSNSTESNFVTIELQQVKFPIGLRYTFPARKLTPYITAAMSNVFHLSTETKWVQVVESGSYVNRYEFEFFKIRNRQFGFSGGLGISKSISSKLDTYMELRYEQTNGIVPFSMMGLGSKITNFQVLIGIRTK